MGAVALNRCLYDCFLIIDDNLVMRILWSIRDSLVHIIKFIFHFYQ